MTTKTKNYQTPPNAERDSFAEFIATEVLKSIAKSPTLIHHYDQEDCEILGVFAWHLAAGLAKGKFNQDPVGKQSA